MTVVIADSSVLILLEKTGMLARLAKHHDIVIPQEVFKEAVEAGIEHKYPDAVVIGKLIKDKAIKVVKVRNEAKVRELTDNYGLATGESEAICLALETKEGVVALDDLKAIRYCERFQIRFVTTIKIVLESYLDKTISKSEARQMLKDLAIFGRYKSELIFYALEKLGDGG